MKNANLSNYSSGKSSIPKQCLAFGESERTNSWRGTSFFPFYISIFVLSTGQFVQTDGDQLEFPGTFGLLHPSVETVMSEEAFFEMYVNP